MIAKGSLPLVFVLVVVLVLETVLAQRLASERKITYPKETK
jgi:hypothetical protein